MMEVTTSRLKYNMKKYMQLVQQGHELLILQGKKKIPIAYIKPIKKKKKRILGRLSKYGPIKLEKFESIEEFLNS